MRWDAERYDSTRAPQIDAGKELIAMAQVRNTDSILDIGCGTGKLTLELARLAHKGKVVGIDPSVEMLEKAREHALSSGNIALINIPAQRIDFREEFDLVYSNSALQWIKEQEDVAVLLYRALKKGGRIAVQLPAKDFCWEFFDYIENAITLLGYKKFFVEWEMPWYFPTKEAYISLLKGLGFSKIEVLYKDYRLVFESISEVLNWWSSAGIRPYLALLPGREQEYFKYAFAMSFENNRTRGGIEFGFRRLFAFAEKR